MLIGKTILITGGSSGIGQKIALECNRNSAKVIILGRDEKKLETTYEKMSDKSKCEFYHCELEDSNSIDNLIQLTDLSSVNGFVHSAGISVTTPIKLQSIDILSKAIHTNVMGAFQLLNRLLEVSLSLQSIVLISSVMSLVGQMAKLSYCASKGALDASMKTIAIELSTQGIRVNSILPGAVKTQLQESLFLKLPEEARIEIERKHPSGLGDTGDIASLTLFLLSEKSRFITGEQFVIDGGYICQ